MKRVFLLFLLSVSVLTVHGVEPEEFKYRAVTEADLDGVRSEWQHRDLAAKSVDIVLEDIRDDYTLIVVRHFIGSRAHFGAIVLPNVDSLSGAPVAVIPDSLYQGSANYDIDETVEWFQSFKPLNGFIKIFPGFRGRIATAQDEVWFSRGDFCDAFDGPTDDSIAMLNVAEQLYPEADFQNVLVRGGSRGGTVALLMAVRDERVNTVIALGAPVDFYRKSWQVPPGDQYRCQFFDEKTDGEARQRILASSPLFFAPKYSLESVSMHHDEGDSIVLVWNANEMEAHLKSHDVMVNKYLYPTDWHGAMVAEPEFAKNLEADIAEFLNRTSN